MSFTCRNLGRKGVTLQRGGAFVWFDQRAWLLLVGAFRFVPPHPSQLVSRQRRTAEDQPMPLAQCVVFFNWVLLDNSM